LKRLRFAAFDIISWNGQSVDEPFAETWKRIVATFGAGDRVHPVEARNASDCSAIAKIYGEWVEEEGAEGLVVRSDTAGRFKIKPRHTLDAAVIGFTESTDDRQGMMHDLLLAVMREDETLQVLSRVGGGFSDELRRDMLSDLKDMVVESEYAEVNSDHVAYLMVQPEWVVEISCLDLVSQTTRGGSVNRMVLDWNRRDDRYDVIRRLPLASVISPQFVRRREDKSVNVADIRVQQIADLVEIPLLERSAREMTLPKSEVLQREVYVKQQKGETMVRKFVMWQTHKAQESEYFPDYVVHYTDFSPNRKVPLARDIRVSSSREQIDSLWEEFKEANIKKGWEAYVGTNKELAVPEPVPSVASEAPPSDLPNQKATKKPASPRQSPEKKAGGKKVTKSDSTDTQPPNSESSQPTAKKAANKRAATTSVTKNKAAKKPVKKAVKKATPKPKKKSD
ncbi:MAG: hypothetical protein KDA60_14875, partial [Planctomycetales bacterium]|nr:hypothetical protein [Planctomycetales bacterium]